MKGSGLILSVIIPMVFMTLAFWSFKPTEPDFKTAPSPYNFGPDDLIVLKKPLPPMIKGPLFYKQAPARPAPKYAFATRIDGQLVRRDKPARQPGKFAIELVKIAKKPETHFHIRNVDHNNIGYGGGLKIALEIVEKF